MTGAEYKKLRVEALAMSQEGLARALGLSKRAVAEREASDEVREECRLAVEGILWRRERRRNTEVVVRSL